MSFKRTKEKREFRLSDDASKPKVRNPPMAHSSDVPHASITQLVPELDRLAIDTMADWRVPGAALAVVQGGEVA